MAIDAVLERGKSGEVHNVGGKKAESTNIDLVRKMCAITDAAFVSSPQLRERFPNSPAARGEPASQLITFVRDRPDHDRRYAIDCSKLERELGFTASRRLDEGLRATFDWFIANEPWWRAIMDGSYQGWIDAQYASGA